MIRVVQLIFVISAASSAFGGLDEAWAHIHAARWVDAQKVLETEIAGDRTSAGTWYLLGYVQSRLGRLRESNEALSHAIELAPGNFEAHKILGLNYAVMNRLDLAETELTRAAQLAPEHAEINYFLGRVYYTKNHFSLAATQFQKVIQLEPSNVKAHDNLALTFDGWGRYSEAASTWRKAIEIDEQQSARNKWVYLNYGDLLLRNGDTAASVELFRRALATDPSWGKGHYMLGKALVTQGRLPDAASEFETAVQLDSTLAEAYYRLSTVYRVLGKKGDADRAMREFLRAKNKAPKQLSAVGEPPLSPPQ